MKKDRVFKIIYIIAFIIMIFWVGNFHEPWSDEAQSFLIAKTETIENILFKVSSQEGCFPLWVLLLKLLINFGLTFDKIHYVSSIFVIISTIIFINNKKIDEKSRYLIPLGFWVFYQYGIIARNYSILVLAFSLLLLIYDRRHEKRILYFLLLMFFSLISMHGMVISGVLATFYFIELIPNIKKMEASDVCIYLVSYIFLFLVYLMEVLIIMPKSETLVSKNIYLGIYRIIFKTLIFTAASTEKLTIFSHINVISSGLLIILFFKVNKNVKDKSFLLLFIGVLLFHLLVRGAGHHNGVLYLVLMSGIIINIDNTNKEEMIIFLLIQLMYFIICVVSCFNDITMNYSGAKEMAEYIKGKNISLSDVYAIGYETTSVQPYFENKYLNRNKYYYEWLSTNDDHRMYSFYKTSDADTYKYLIEIGDYKYILIQKHNIDKYVDEKEYEKIEKTNMYEKIKETDGVNFFKGNYNETEGFILYKRKEK